MRKTLAFSLFILLLCGTALCGCNSAPKKNELQYSRSEMEFSGYDSKSRLFL